MGSSDGVTRFVTTVMGIVIGLTFLFGFGNVLALALRIGVPVYVAPLVAPAVDLTVLGLLVGTRHLALNGAPSHVVQPARRLLLAASAVTLALNIAEPVCENQWGKAAFDAVGPLLLIGWAEVGPALLRGLQGVVNAPAPAPTMETRTQIDSPAEPAPPRGDASNLETPESRLQADQEKLERARSLNVAHGVARGRPISAETLRRELEVGAATARTLCAIVRSEMTPV